MKTPKSSIVSGYFSFPVPEPTQPHSSDFYPQKKREENCLVYFRFLSAQNATMPMTAATATAAMMAISVVIRGASVGSGSIGVEGDGAASTVMYVAVDDL